MLRTPTNNLGAYLSVNESVEMKRSKKIRIHPPSESTAQFIRDLLLRKGKSYPYEMWKLWCIHLTRLGMKSPKLSSFMKYMYVLVRAGLVRKTTTPTDLVKQPVKKTPFTRSYYEIVSNKARDDKSWSNPQVVVYGERMRLGKRRYRRQVLKLPPAPRSGRPRTSKFLDYIEGKPIEKE